MATNNGGGRDRAVRYRECLRNHGLSMQLYVLDGCGDFAPGGADGTPEAMLCAACGCFRSYHRREEVQPRRPRRRTTTVHTVHRPRAIPAPPPLPPPPPPSSPPPPPPQPPASIRNASQGGDNPPPLPIKKKNPPPSEAGSRAENGGGREEETKRKKKKPKTKFTEAQRARMREFAEKLGWRQTKHDEESIESFCEEIGITPQAYKVWIHNHRYRMGPGESSSSAAQKN